MYIQPTQRKPSSASRVAAIGAAAILLTTLVPMDATAASAQIGFGINDDAAAEFVRDAGQGTLTYATRWAGAWNQNPQKDPEFNGIKSGIDKARAVGATPIIHWWYWGDESGNINCYKNSSDGGCWDRKQEVWKTMPKWTALTIKLADTIRSKVGPGEAIVVVETEFNKGGNINGDYADDITRLLQWKVDYFQSRGIKAMISLGNWDKANWHKFADAVRSSDYAGTMLLWSCVHEAAVYTTAAQRLVTDTAFLKQTFPTKHGGAPMQIIVPDFGVSTYNCNAGDDYETKQETVIRDLMAKRQDLKNNDVVGVSFRGLVDSIMDPANHHGAAENYWGFKRLDAARTWKKSYDDVIALVQAEMQTNNPPTASFTKSCSALACSVDGRSSSDAEGPIASWTWKWGDGTADGTGSTASHTYAAPGTYTVTLTVRDSAGATAQTSQSVTVASGGNQPPTARFTKSCTGLACTFDGGASSDPDGAISTYSWSFGDGGTATGRTASRTYAAAGTYTVTLTVTDNAGGQGATSQQTTVSAAGSNPALPGAREAEDFTHDVGGLYTNAAWSGGKGWNIWTTGGIHQTFDNPTSTRYRFTIKAAGDLAGTAPPHMVLRADGVIIGQWDVPTTSLASYTVDAALAAGDVTLRIEFTNDFNTNGDRNLRVDVLTVEVASTALPATIEAENFEYKSTGGVYPNAAWSGGKGWNIWNTGGIEHTVHNPGTAKYRFTIKAAGDLAGPDPPRMVLKVNGAIIAQWDVTSEALWPYTVDATLQPGDARLRIEFTNDYNQLGDRNLRVDLIQIAATAPTLPGSFEAENFEFKSTGGVYPNAAWSGGKGWNIWSLGHIDQRVYNPTARTATVTIKAAGDAAANVAPHMVLKANGAVIGEWDVTSSSLLSYATTVALGAGDVTFWIEFTNDYNQNGQDRNLRVDVLQVT